MEQGDKEWWDAHMGRISASRMGDVVANPTTKRYKQYRKELVLGRRGIGGFEPDPTDWSEYGHLWEPVARAQYEWERGVLVHQIALLHSQDCAFVICSPDGLVGEDGGIEIKSRINQASFDKYKGTLPAINRWQVQANLWVSGRDWWDLVSFFPTDNLDIVRVLPDKKAFKKMHDACTRLLAEVQEEVSGNQMEDHT